jgi:hypothetical protein
VTSTVPDEPAVPDSDSDSSGDDGEQSDDDAEGAVLRQARGLWQGRKAAADAQASAVAEATEQLPGRVGRSARGLGGRSNRGRGRGRGRR